MKEIIELLNRKMSGGKTAGIDGLMRNKAFWSATLAPTTR